MYVHFVSIIQSARGEGSHSPRCKWCKGREKEIANLLLRWNYGEWRGNYATSRRNTRAEKKRFARAEIARARTFALARGAIRNATLPRLFHDFPPPPSLPSSRGRSTNPGSSVIPRALSGSRTCPRVAIPLFGVCRTRWMIGLQKKKQRGVSESAPLRRDSRYVSTNLH